LVREQKGNNLFSGIDRRATFLFLDKKYFDNQLLILICGVH